MFDAEIHKYKHLVDEIHDLPASKVIGSLKVDAKPVKNALSSVISKWVHQFQVKHLGQWPTTAPKKSLKYDASVPPFLPSLTVRFFFPSSLFRRTIFCKR
jgi:hypothetical protein